MKKVYIASHSKEQAVILANTLLSDNSLDINIISSWIYQPFNPTITYSDEEKIDIAMTDFNEVSNCDILILIAGNEKYSGGKFVEIGIALALNKNIFILGRRENMLLWNKNILQYDSVDGLVHDITLIIKDQKERT